MRKDKPTMVFLRKVDGSCHLVAELRSGKAVYRTANYVRHLAEEKRATAAAPATSGQFQKKHISYRGSSTT